MRDLLRFRRLSLTMCWSSVIVSTETTSCNIYFATDPKKREKCFIRFSSKILLRWVWPSVEVMSRRSRLCTPTRNTREQLRMCCFSRIIIRGSISSSNSWTINLVTLSYKNYSNTEVPKSRIKSSNLSSNPVFRDGNNRNTVFYPHPYLIFTRKPCYHFHRRKGRLLQSHASAKHVPTAIIAIAIAICSTVLAIVVAPTAIRLSDATPRIDETTAILIYFTHVWNCLSFWSDVENDMFVSLSLFVEFTVSTFHVKEFYLAFHNLLYLIIFNFKITLFIFSNILEM